MPDFVGSNTYVNELLCPSKLGFDVTMEMTAVPFAADAGPSAGAGAGAGAGSGAGAGAGAGAVVKPFLC